MGQVVTKQWTGISLRSQNISQWSMEAAGLITLVGLCHFLATFHVGLVGHVFSAVKRSFFIALSSRNNKYAKHGKYFQEWELQSVATSAFQVCKLSALYSKP